MKPNSAERKEILQLTIRQMIEKIPVIGPFINNVFLEYRSSVKQKRLNSFLEKVGEELKDIDIDPEKLRTEECVDLFDTIVKKVADTRLENKREGLKNILVFGIQYQDQVEFCELFATILLDIHPKELEILGDHQQYVLAGKGPLPRMKDMEWELEQLKFINRSKQRPIDIMNNYRIDASYKPRPVHIVSDEYTAAKKLLEKYQKNCVCEKFGISNDELKFFKQNLLSKGLLQDDGAGAIDTGATEIMSITSLGLKFLAFIKL